MKQTLAFLALLCACSIAAHSQVHNTISSSPGTGCVAIAVGPKATTVAIAITGTWSGTLQPEVAVQGQAPATTQVTPTTSSTAASTITANGIYTTTVRGFDSFLLCGNTVATGTANVFLNISTAP